jgi:DNA-binding transcriptional regulator YiaG
MTKELINRIFDLSGQTNAGIAKILVVSSNTVRAWREGRKPNIKSQKAIRDNFKKEIATFNY